jgi:hypothetical protein
MKRAFLILAMIVGIACVSLSQAKDRHQNHIGQLLRMETVRCGPDDVGALSKAIFGGPVPGPEERLCPEYILQSEGLYYRIRPRDHKHPALLPLGEQAQFHFQKDRMLLQIEDFDDETYEFSVLAIIPENHSESLLPPTHIVIGPPQ